MKCTAFTKSIDKSYKVGGLVGRVFGLKTIRYYIDCVSRCAWSSNACSNPWSTDFYAYTSYTLLELLTPLSVSSSKNPPASGGWNEI